MNNTIDGQIIEFSQLMHEGFGTGDISISFRPGGDPTEPDIKWVIRVGENDNPKACLGDETLMGAMMTLAAVALAKAEGVTADDKAGMKEIKKRVREAAYGKPN